MKIEAKQRLIAALNPVDAIRALELNCRHMKLDFEPAEISVFAPKAPLGIATLNGVRFIVTLTKKGPKSMMVHFDPQRGGQDVRDKDATQTLIKRMDALGLRTFRKPTGVEVNIDMDDLPRESYPDIPSFPKIRK